jgi:hypothetical protein
MWKFSELKQGYWEGHGEENWEKGADYEEIPGSSEEYVGVNKINWIDNINLK